MNLKHDHPKLGIRAVFCAAWLIAFSASAQDVVWASQGFADEQAIPASAVYPYNGGSVTVSWQVVESGGGMNSLPGSGTGSGGGGNDYVSYESSGQVGGKDNIIVMGFNNDANDPDDWVDVTYSFSQPQYGFRFTLLDIDTGSWDDGVEVTINGSINLRDNPAWWSFEVPGNPTVIVDDEPYYLGFEGDRANAGGTDPAGNLICNVSGVQVTTLRYRFFSTDDADANPGGQKVGFTDLLVVQPDLISSTKSVVDLNGGLILPGDTLEYTVSVTETAGNGAYATVSDALPAGLENLSVVSAPADGIDTSTTSNLSVSGFFVPGNGTVDVVFRADVSNSPPPPIGTAITNTATVTEAFGSVNNPTAVVVVGNPGSGVGVTGVKPLYLHASALDNNDLSRVQPAASSVFVDKDKPAKTWILAPVLATNTTFEAGTIPVALWLYGENKDTIVNINLSYTDGAGGSGALPQVSLTNIRPPKEADGGPPVLYTIDIPLASDLVLSAGAELTLAIDAQDKKVWVQSVGPGIGNYSTINPTALKVINVDSVGFYDAPYPGGAVLPETEPGETVYIRSVVSDPFGSFDINDTTDPTELTLTDPLGATATQTVITVVATDTATKTYEFAYTIPNGSAAGYWSAGITAHEGFEGTLEHTGYTSIESVLPVPDLVVVKSSTVISDPVNGAADPKRIPGAIVEYRILVNNSGTGGGDTDSIELDDAIPQNTAMIVSDVYGAAGPVLFIPDTGGLTYSYSGLGNGSDDLSFHSAASTNYTPSASGDGSDPDVTSVHLNPKGTLNGSSSFEFRFQVLVQ